MLLETLSGAKPPEEGVHHPYFEHEQQFGGAGEGGDTTGHDDADGDGDGGASAEAKFCTAWLLCVGSATVGSLLAKVCSCYQD